MFLYVTVLAVVGIIVPMANAAHYAKLIQRRFYMTAFGFVILSILSVVYYDWYSDLYLTKLSGAMGSGIAFVACSWMVFMLFLFIPLLIMRVLSYLIHNDIVWKWLAHSLILGTFAVSIYGCVYGNTFWEREYLNLSYAHLPRSFDRMKIALIADTHIGPYYHVDDLRAQLEDAYRENADYVIIAGDLIDDIRVLPNLEAVLTEAYPHFRYGIDFVWGNHEYYRGREDIEQALKRTPVRIWRNTNGIITQGADRIYLAGVDYPFAKGDALKKMIEAYTEKALQGIPQDAFTILLAHHPDFIESGFRNHIPLTVAGHSHGEQIGVMGQPIFPLYQYNRGMFRDQSSVGYVSRGTGHWFPFRFGCSREITYITLRKK